MHSPPSYVHAYRHAYSVASVRTYFSQNASQATIVTVMRHVHQILGACQRLPGSTQHRLKAILNPIPEEPHPTPSVEKRCKKEPGGPSNVVPFRVWWYGFWARTAKIHSMKLKKELCWKVQVYVLSALR